MKRDSCKSKKKIPELSSRKFGDWLPLLMSINPESLRGRILALVYWDYLSSLKGVDLELVHGLRLSYPFNPEADCTDREVYLELRKLGYPEYEARARSSGAGYRAAAKEVTPDEAEFRIRRSPVFSEPYRLHLPGPEGGRQL
jgi:hypothetical protein